MSLNQLLNPISTGLDINVHSVKSLGSLPKVVTSPYTITQDDMITGRTLLASNDSTAVTFTFPSVASLQAILPSINDSLKVTVKYRTFGVVTVNSIDNLFYLPFGNSYVLKASDGSTWVTAEIGVCRTTIAGSLRLF